MARTFAFAHIQRILRQSYQENSPDFSRRDFLKNAGFATGAVALSPFLSSHAWAKSAHEGPIAIVGAGAAGLSAAYEFKKKKIPYVLYEASARLGGRIWTDYQTFAGQGQFCELGAELVNTGHKSIRRLATELGVKIESFPAPGAGVDVNLFFHKGHRYTDTDALLAAKPLMKAVLIDLKKIFGADEPETITYDSEFKETAVKYDRMSMRQYLDSVPDLEPWFKEILNSSYESENGVATDQQPALTFFSYFTDAPSNEFHLYGTSDELSRIQGGNSKLIEALHKSLGTTDETLKLQHELLRVRELGSDLELTFKTNGGTKSIRHSQVVLALPFTVLRHVEGFSDAKLNLDKRVLRVVKELQFGFDTKTMFGFTEKYWRKPNATQHLYTGSGSSDLFTSVLWETSRAQADTGGILTAFLGGQKAFNISPEKIPSMLQDIEKIYPGALAHFNEKTAQFNWGKNRLARTSYSAPGLGQYTTLRGLTDKEQMKGRLFFAGEHTSIENFGYMDGAIDSGVRVASQVALTRGIKLPAEL